MYLKVFYCLDYLSSANFLLFYFLSSSQWCNNIPNAQCKSATENKFVSLFQSLEDRLTLYLTLQQSRYDISRSWQWSPSPSIRCP